jgi:acyl-CoA oxidase
MCHLIDLTSRQVESSKARGFDNFKAKNDAQVHKARNLSLALAEFYSLCSLKTKILSNSTPRDLEKVLLRIFTIYGFWNLDKHMATFYIGGFANGSDFSDFVRSTLTKACEEIKESSVAIADALSPPDFVLNSVIGKSDGKVS